MKLKDVIAYCLVISLGIILAMHFVLFWIFGGVFIYEDNKAVLLLETVMSVAILGFGIERLLSAPGSVNDHAPEAAFNGERAARTADDDLQATISARTNRPAPRRALYAPDIGPYTAGPVKLDSAIAARSRPPSPHHATRIGPAWMQEEGLSLQSLTPSTRR
jgi:hypothetical protein